MPSNWKDIQALVDPSNASTSSDYSSTSPQDLLKDPFFRRDIVENAKANDMKDFTFEEALAEWYNEQSYAAMNELGAAFGDAGYFQTSTLQGESRDRMARLTAAYEVMPNVLTTGAGGGSISDELSGAEITKTLGGANILNPTNVIGGGAAKATAYGALAAGKSVGSAAFQAGKAGAKKQALAGAGSEMAISGFGQSRDINLGNSDEFSYAKLGTSAIAGAAANYGIAFLLGAATTPLARAKLRKDNSTLLSRGFSQSEIDESTKNFGGDGLTQLLKYESKAELDAELAGSEPKLETEELVEEAVPTFADRENIDIDLEQIALQRKDAERRLTDTENPPTASEKADLIEDSDFLQELESRATDLNKRNAEIAELEAQIVGVDPKDSVQIRARIARLAAESNQAKRAYKIGFGIYQNLKEGDSYADGLLAFKKAQRQAAAESKANANKSEAEAPQAEAPKPAKAAPEATPVQNPVQVDTQVKSPEQEAEEVKIVNEEVKIARTDPEVNEEVLATPEKPAEQVVVDQAPDDAIKKSVLEIEGEDTAPIIKAIRESFDELERTIEVATQGKKKGEEVASSKKSFGAKGEKVAKAVMQDENLNTKNLDAREKNKVAKEILKRIDPNFKESSKLPLPQKLARIEERLQEIETEVSVPKADKVAKEVPKSAANPEVGRLIKEEMEAPEATPEVKAEKANEDQVLQEIKEAIEIESDKTFELPKTLVDMVESQGDPETSKTLATLFTSIVESGAEFVLSDQKLMKQIIDDVFGKGSADSKKLFQEYKKIKEGLETEDFEVNRLGSQTDASTIDSNFEKEFIANYVAERKSRVAAKLKTDKKFSTYWDSQANKVSFFDDLLKARVAGWKKDARQMLREQYQIRGASLDHWEMFSNIGPSKKASEAYIKKALSGELLENRAKVLQIEDVMSRDNALALAKKQNQPVAFIAANSIRAKFVLTEGYPVNSRTGKDGRIYHSIPAGQIVYMSHTNGKVYQSPVELLQNEGLLRIDQRDTYDIGQHINVGDFRDPKKLLGQGFDRLVKDYYNSKNVGRSVGKQGRTTNEPKRNKLKNFIVSRFLLQQELNGKKGGSRYTINPVDDAPQTTTSATAPKSAPKFTQNLDEVVLPKGYRLAALNGAGTEIRVITDKQLENGGGVNQLLGKASDEQWLVGMVPEGSPRVSALSKDLVIDLFQEVSEQPIKRLFTDVAPNMKDLQNIKPEDVMEPEEIKFITDETFKFFGKKITKERVLSDMAGVNMALTRLDIHVQFLPNGTGFDDSVKQAMEILRIQDKYFPNGVGFTTQTRRQTIREARNIMAGFEPDAKIQAEVLLDAIGKENYDAVEKLFLRVTGAVDQFNPKDGAPTMLMERGNRGGAHRYGASGTSDILLKPEAQVNHFPSFTSLVHEVGHWSYNNAMTPKMRMEFWNELKTSLYTDGKLDADKLAKATGYAEEDLGAKFLTDNKMSTSTGVTQAEFFANAFEKWALNARHGDVEVNTMWRRMAKFIEGVFKKMQGKESGNPKLDAIFARLYPEDTAATRQARKVVEVFDPDAPPQRVLDAESTIQSYLRIRTSELTKVWKTFSPHISENGTPAGEKPFDVIFDARNLSRFLNSLSITRGESRVLSALGQNSDPIIGPADTNKTGAFTVVSKAGYSKKLRVLAKDINAIYSKYLAGESNQAAQPDEKFDYDEFQKIIEDYDAGRELTDKQIEFIDTAAESAGVDSSQGMDLVEKINEVYIFMEGNTLEVDDFETELGFYQMHAEPTDVSSAAKEITALIQDNRDMIDQVAELLTDKYYRLSKENYAIALPSDKALKQEHFTGRKPVTPLGRLVKNAYSSRNKNSNTSPASSNASNVNFISLNKKELANKHQEALDSGDKETLEGLYYEAHRRSETESIHSLSGKDSINSSQVSSAIEMESIGKVDGEGIWIDAPLSIRDSAKMMTHRDPEVQANMRLMFQRMYGLINASTRGIVDDIPLLDTHTLGKITGENYSEVDGVVKDLSTAKFGGLRSDFRRIVVGLNREDSDPKALMHEIGHIFKRALPEENLLVIRDAFKLAVKAEDPVAVDFAGRYTNSSMEDRAEEWFVESWANYLANRVSKADITSSKMDYSQEGGGGLEADMLEMKGKLGQYADLLSEYVAYGLNGLIGRNDVKQMFRRLTFSGNLIKRENILGNISNHHVPSQYLNDFAQQAINDMPEEGVRRLSGFVSGSISGARGRIKPFYYSNTGGSSGKLLPNNFTGSQKLDGAIYVAESHGTANKVFTNQDFKADSYNKKDIADAASRVAVRDDQDPKSMSDYALGELRKLEAFISQRHAYIDQAIRFKNAVDDPSLSDKAERNSMAYEQSIDQIENSNDAIGEIVDMFQTRLGVAPVEHSSVVVSSVTREEVISFSSTTPLDENNRGLFKDILTLITPSIKESAYRTLSQKIDDADSAANAFEVLQSVAGSSTSIPRALKDLNFKGVKLTSDSGEEFMALLVPEKVKRINDPDFVNPESVPRLEETQTLSTIVGEMVINASDEQAPVSLDPSIVAKHIGSMIEKNGSNGSSADVISQMTRGFIGNGEQGKKLAGNVKGMFDALLAENSVQIRTSGMRWLGNLIKPEEGVGHYEKHGSRVGKKVMPILKLIQDISGTEKGAGRRYLDRVNQWGYKPSVSEARVLKAMRRPAGSKQEQLLRGDERKLYDMLRKQFKSELEEMRSQGLFIGNIKNYIPQVWDINVINRNAETRAAFTKSMASYFKSEARNRGEDLADDLATERATKMMTRLTNDDGVYIPSRPNNQTESQSDHFDFSRVIRLDEFPDHLDDLEGYLVNDLGGLTTKYFNESSRRVLITEDFGIESHAFYDYMEAHENGIKGAAKLLKSGKVYRRAVESIDGETVTEFERSLMMPIARSDAHGTQLLNQAMSIMESDGQPAAKEFLLSQAMKRQPALERRIDAILTALSETGGKTSSTTTDYKHAFGMFDTLRGRSPSRGGTYNETARSASKGARMFNSVSLLSYTVITSMTDLVLPVIRSGSLPSAMKGLKKVNLDPDYREAIRNVGAGMASIAHNKLVHMSGGEGDKLSNAFFSGIGLNQWTEYMRDYAASTAYEAIKAEQRIAIRDMKGDGTNLAMQSADFRRAKRFLARVGLGHFAERGSESLDNMKLLENDQVREAIHRMTNEAVFAPNGNDIPLIWQSPLGSVLFQFKSFPLMMGRLARRAIWDEVGKPMLTKGEPVNLAPAAMLLTLAPIFGEQVLSVREAATAKGGEEGGEYKRRERSANKFLETFGADEDDPVFESAEMDALAGRYVEGFMYAGGFGLLADLFHQSAEQIDNGAYGNNRIASTFLGPTYGSVFGTLVNIGAGAVDKNDDSNSKERQAWREVIGRIPLIGQNRQIKEDAVDYLAGEASR